jgi:hypothetical protein
VTLQSTRVRQLPQIPNAQKRNANSGSPLSPCSHRVSEWWAVLGSNQWPLAQLKQQEQQGSGNAACITNYECQIASNNTPPGSATVALVIGDVDQCSGSLINDVPGDNTPYVLTARHCETGLLGGGDPGAASAVTVYWDATTPCGAALGSIYDTSIAIQTGANFPVNAVGCGTTLCDQRRRLIRHSDIPAVCGQGTDERAGSLLGVLGDFFQRFL